MHSPHNLSYYFKKTPPNRWHLPKNMPGLIFITDCHKITDMDKTIKALPDNTLVIIRDYLHPKREHFAHRIRELCAIKKHPVLIAKTAALANKLAVDGIHLPEHDMAAAAYWRKKKPNWIITVAIHSRTALKKAQSFPVNAVLASPVFPTTSHKTTHPIGIKELAEWLKITTLPLYALGGINYHNIAPLLALPIAGVAAIDGFSTSNTTKSTFLQHSD